VEVPQEVVLVVGVRLVPHAFRNVENYSEGQHLSESSAIEFHATWWVTT
jgi:hypothetical protein